MKQDKSRSSMGPPHGMDDSGIDRSSDNEDDYDNADDSMGDDYNDDEEYFDDYRPPPPNKRGRGTNGRGGGMFRGGGRGGGRGGQHMDYSPRGQGGRGGPHGGGGPRFRGRGYGPRGPPPGFRGGPPGPHFGGPRGPRFRGGPPPNWDQNWGGPGGPPMQGHGGPMHGGPPPPHHMMGGPPPGGMGPPPPHMMGPGPNGPGPGGPMGMPPPFGPPPGMGGPPPMGSGPPPLMQPPNMIGGMPPPGMPNGPPMNMPPMGMPPPGSLPPTNIPPPMAGGATSSGGTAASPSGPASSPAQTPGMDFTGEIWVETKASEGKSYFYNARTRETTWTKPEGNVKILLQEQVEAMAQAAGVAQTANNSNNGNNGQEPMESEENSNDAVGSATPTSSSITVSTSTPTNSNTPTTATSQPATSTSVTPSMAHTAPVQTSTHTQSPMGAMSAPPMAGMQGMMGPPPLGMMGMGIPNTMQPPPSMMGPPPGMYGGPPGPFGGPPPFGMPPPGFPPGGFGGFPQGPWGMPPQAMMPQAQQPMMPVQAVVPTPVAPVQAPITAASTPQPDEATPQIDPEIVAKAAEWSEHRAPDGKFYYYNAKLGESVWQKPQPLKDLETAKLAAAQGVSTLPQAGVITGSATTKTAAKPISDDGSSSDGEKSPQSHTVNGTPSKVDSEEEERRKQDLLEKAKKEAEDKAQEELAMKKKEEEEEKAKEIQKAQDKSKPVSSTPVPGTPWCVVWTGDGRVFFYNPSSRTSVWERPEELVGRADVDKMVASAPESAQVSTDSPAVKRESTTETEAQSAKKQKMENSKQEPTAATVTVTTEVKEDKKQIDIGKEAAMEAEVRAARERAIVPLETRIKSFREMLAEKEVSAFSTWEKELHKIVFDPRYLLLTSKERKQVFDKYVKERAEEERREKRNKLKERKDEYRKLMEEAGLHGKSSFGDFAQKYGKDDRFKNIEKMRERESLFNEYLLEVRKREKDEKNMRREQVKRDFCSLLREHPEIDRHTRWSDIKKRIDSDPRYKGVDSSALREDWFREYQKMLKEERKKEKEKDRERKDKDRRDRGDKEKEVKPENESEMDGETDAEQEKEREKEKAARVEASLREREKEVQRTLAVHLRDRDNEREQHKHDEAVQHFNALLADLVRNSELVWREAKRQLRKDHRWELAELLDREEKEKLFTEHIEQLGKKKKEKFRELLNETSEVSLSCSWKEVRKLIKDDPRYSKFSSSEKKCEREFKDYIKDKMVAAKAEIRELLQETKLITHKTFSMLKENESTLKEIEEILKKDKRYLELDHIPEERHELVMAYLEDLEKRGPPPPPTASEPSRRITK